MGGRHSRPAPIYPPNDPLFTQIGCTGLRQNDYQNTLLESAPFLYFKITSNNYNDLYGTIISIIKQINPSNADLSNSSSSIWTNINDLHFNINISSNPQIDSSIYTPTYFNNEQKQAIAEVSNGKTHVSTYTQQNVATNKNINFSIPGVTASTSKVTNKIADKAQPIFTINDNKPVYGPIYLLTAFNIKTKIIESYLYFPTMSKDMKPCTNYNTIGINHNWLYRLIYNYQYRYIPYSNCQIRTGKRPTQSNISNLINLAKDNKLKQPSEMAVMRKTPGGTSSSISPVFSQLDCQNAYGYGLKQGCISTDNSCQQSDGVHRGMGIYRDGLNSNAYPSFYFTSYTLNLNDSRIKDYINSNSFKNIQRNILTDITELYTGCQYMLISPNGKYYLALGSMSLITFYNIDNVDLNEYCFKKKSPKRKVPVNGKIFKDCTITRAFMEDGFLKIYGTSDYDDTETEQLLFAILLTKDLSYPICLILTNSGELLVMNNSNKILNKINISQDFKSVSSNKESDSIQSKDKISYIKQYNSTDDYRQRLLNLIMFLKERDLYRDDPFYSNITQESTIPHFIPEANNIHTQVITHDIPRFNSALNYLNRFDELSAYLQAAAAGNDYKQKIIENDISKYRPGGYNNTNTQSQKKKDLADIIANSDSSFANTPDNNPLVDETPEEKAKRLDAEAAARKKKYDDDQTAKGITEDTSLSSDAKDISSGGDGTLKIGVLNNNKIIVPNTSSATGKIINNYRVGAPDYDGLEYNYYSKGVYDYDTDLEIRKRNLNSYYLTSSPNNIDYYQQKQTVMPVFNYNYTDDRNNRMNMIKI